MYLEDSLRSKANLPTDLFQFSPRGFGFHICSILDLCCKPQQKGLISVRYGTKSCNVLPAQKKSDWEQHLSRRSSSQSLMGMALTLYKGSLDSNLHSHHERFSQSHPFASVPQLSCSYKAYFLPCSCSLSLFSLFCSLFFNLVCRQGPVQVHSTTVVLSSFNVS